MKKKNKTFLTIIIIVIAIITIATVIYFLSFQTNYDSIDNEILPFEELETARAVKKACQIACDEENLISLCCAEFEIGNERAFCSDERLGLGCSTSCETFNCNEPQE